MRITGMEGVCKSGELGLRDPVLKHYSIDSSPNSQKAKPKLRGKRLSQGHQAHTEAEPSRTGSFLIHVATLQ